MINEIYFNETLIKTRTYKYSSINYIDYKDAKNVEILHDIDNSILWLDTTKKRPLLYYATNDFSQVVKALMDIGGKLQLNFVPKEYVTELNAHGFIEWGEYQGFFSRHIAQILTDFPCDKPTALAKLDDAKDVMAVVNSCELQSRGFEGHSLSFYEEMASHGKILVFRKNKAIVGVCIVDIYDSGMPTLHIREIATIPAYQGQGIAKKLLSQAFRWGMEHGASQAFLMADIINTNAISLYEKYGFVPDGDESELQMIRE